MALHPGEPKHVLPEDAPVEGDPIRRDLGKNEDWYRDLVEHSEDLLCVHDLEGRFLLVNPVPARLLGYSVEEMLQKPMRDFLDPQFRVQFDAYLREIERTGECRGLLTVLTRTGERRVWEYRNTLRTEGVERPIVRGIAHDVTERMRTKKAVRLSNQRLQESAIEHEQFATQTGAEALQPRLERDLRAICSCNETLLRAVDEKTLLHDICRIVCDEAGYRMAWVGYVQHDAAKTVRPVAWAGFEDGYLATANLSWDDTERGSGPTGLAMRGGASVYIQDFATDPIAVPWREDALRRGYRSSLAVPLKDDHDNTFGELGIYSAEPNAFTTEEIHLLEKLADNLAFGITVIRARVERKRTEEALRQSEERLRLFIEHTPAALAMFDRDMRYLLISPRWQVSYGLGDRDLRGLSHYDVFPEIPERWKEAHRRALAGEFLREEEDRFDRADGSVQWIHWEILPWHNDAGGIGGLVIFTEDITERKQAEETLRLSAERFRVALKNSPIAVFNQDRDLRYTWVYNPQLPLPASETLGKTSFELFDAEEAARTTDVRRGVLETGVGVRDEMQITFGGRKHYFDVTIEPVFDSNGAVLGLTGASTDVTELRETTEALLEAKKKLTEEKLYLEQEIDVELGFGEIIGRSAALQAVMENVGKVAASNATVLLLGETGTGKELVARAIHRLSQRAGSSFIKMNCAAIPSGLLESELFGNEKGAFTGSVSKKIGRLELADKGTLFLDEIGDISLALQPKLLRVLQDQEFERLGGIQTLKVDFRLIAATNRDLAESVREKEFRSDLYYRLNVFPIRLPPLRERRDDIGLLVEHFVQKFARRMKKLITTIPKKAMDALRSWEWPGNVRELENFIERSVILTQGSVLVVSLSELQPTGAAVPAKRTDDSLEATEREHILRALRQSHGQIGGSKGAATRLGLKRTTLQSKLKHLGINPRPGPTES
jgi:formate hydrogenlyase transcriptional activator